MNRDAAPTDPKASVRSVSAQLRRSIAAPTRRIDDLPLQSLHEIKLLLRGESVVDWHRLYVDSLDDARRLLVLNGLDPNAPDDLAYAEALRGEASAYIGGVLKLRIDDHVARQVPFLELFLLASGQGKYQRQACVLLKVIHILHHLDAREVRTRLPLSDTDLFALVEDSVTAMFDDLRDHGVPLVEFAWSRKARNSLITKLLVKRETSAARVFDRIRFRLVVRAASDLAPTLHAMLQRCVPFNYIVPGETVNTLVDRAVVLVPDETESEADVPATDDPSPVALTNEFSSADFRVLNFIADLPIRVDGLDLAGASASPHAWGKVVFVLCEFQILDEATSLANEHGDSSHERYKQRQHGRVKERLLRAPSGSGAARSDGNGDGDGA